MELFSGMLKKKDPDCYPMILNRMGTIAIFMTILDLSNKDRKIGLGNPSCAGN